MQISIIDGIPHLIRTIEKKPKVKVVVTKKRNEMGIKELPERERTALVELMKKGAPFTNEKKQQAAETAGYSIAHGNGIKAMDRLLKRKPIVDALVKENITDERIAKVISDGLDANHPLSKDDKPDFMARHKYVQEVNKIMDNYPPKRIEQQSQNIHVHLTTDNFKQLKKAEEMRQEHD